MSFLAEKPFWIQSIERAVKTVAQTAVATITANATGLLDADWLTVGSVSGLAGLVSLLTSIGSGYVGDDDSPSLVD
ncbi:MAG: holin [Paracoccus sp. (in: a-proteobacteria)]